MNKNIQEERKHSFHLSSLILHPCSFILYNDVMPRSHVNGRRRTRGAKGKDGKNERRADRGREKNLPSAERDESLKGQTPLRTLSRELRRLLEGIGTPAPAPFKPDPFQWKLSPHSKMKMCW